MKTENINLEELSREYSTFLQTNPNAGCPMLATALQSLVGGRVVIGKFAGDLHCWVETENRRYDLNNLVEGCGICLILSHLSEKCYEEQNDRIDDGNPPARSFAFELGVGKDFYLWTDIFKKAMERTMADSSTCLKAGVSSATIL